MNRVLVPVIPMSGPITHAKERTFSDMTVTRTAQTDRHPPVAAPTANTVQPTKQDSGEWPLLRCRRPPACYPAQAGRKRGAMPLTMPTCTRRRQKGRLRLFHGAARLQCGKSRPARSERPADVVLDVLDAAVLSRARPDAHGRRMGARTAPRSAEGPPAALRHLRDRNDGRSRLLYAARRAC